LDLPARLPATVWHADLAPAAFSLPKLALPYRRIHVVSRATPAIHSPTVGHSVSLGGRSGGVGTHGPSGAGLHGSAHERGKPKPLVPSGDIERAGELPRDVFSVSCREQLRFASPGGSKRDAVPLPLGPGCRSRGTWKPL
jgi:hypothetical protein